MVVDWQRINECEGRGGGGGERYGNLAALAKQGRSRQPSRVCLYSGKLQCSHLIWSIISGYCGNGKLCFVVVLS